MHGGKSISFRRLEAILGASYAVNYGSTALNQGFPGVAQASGPLALTEGTPGAATDYTWSQILATVSQYGQYVYVTDMAELQSLDDQVANMTDNLGEAMLEGADLILRDIVVSGTNVQYASTATTRLTVGSGMNLNLAELREAKRTLLKGNAKPLASEGGKYVVITHTDPQFDLEGDSNITNMWQYAGDRGLDKNQLFDVAFRDLPLGFRIYETTLARIYASLGLSGCDVYATMVLGEEFYGQIDLDSMPAAVIVKERGSAGTSDPLNQVGSIGYKFALAGVILNQNVGVRIESNATAKQGA